MAEVEKVDNTRYRGRGADLRRALALPLFLALVTCHSSLLFGFSYVRGALTANTSGLFALALPSDPAQIITSLYRGAQSAVSTVTAAVIPQNATTESHLASDAPARGCESRCENSMGLSFRAILMGPWPTRGNENQGRRPGETCSPRKRGSGGHLCAGTTMDSRFRGNDTHGVTFRRSEGDEEARTALKILRARFLAQFTPSGQSEIPRFARNDSEGLGTTARTKLSRRLFEAIRGVAESGDSLTAEKSLAVQPGHTFGVREGNKTEEAPNHRASRAPP